MKIAVPTTTLLAVVALAPGAFAGPAAYGICQVSVYSPLLSQYIAPCIKGFLVPLIPPTSAPAAFTPNPCRLRYVVTDYRKPDSGRVRRRGGSLLHRCWLHLGGYHGSDGPGYRPRVQQRLWILPGCVLGGFGCTDPLTGSPRLPC